MKIGEAFKSKYLKKEDFPSPRRLTIRGVKMQSMKSFDSEQEEEKAVMYFLELEKGLILNRTNADTCTQMFVTDDCDAWMNRQVEVWNDMNVSFGGKRGGLRIKWEAQPQPPAVTPALAPAPAAAPDPAPVQYERQAGEAVQGEPNVAPDEDIPF